MYPNILCSNRTKEMKFAGNHPVVIKRMMSKFERHTLFDAWLITNKRQNQPTLKVTFSPNSVLNNVQWCVHWTESLCIVNMNQSCKVWNEGCKIKSFSLNSRKLSIMSQIALQIECHHANNQRLISYKYWFLTLNCFPFPAVWKWLKNEFAIFETGCFCL